MFVKITGNMLGVYILGNNHNESNSIYEEMKDRLKSGIAYYHSVQNLPSSTLLPKNVKLKTYKTIISPVVLHGLVTWSLLLREECKRLRVLENRVLWRMCRPKRDEVTGEWRRLHNEKLHALYSFSNVTRVINQEE
jgi:hypothetical protein